MRADGRQHREAIVAECNHEQRIALTAGEDLHDALRQPELRVLSEREPDNAVDGGHRARRQRRATGS
jgi:hypothetical protein